MIAEQTNTKLGEYILTHHLAHGGMSEVYLARAESSEQVYAIKLVEKADEDYYRRFQREAQVLRKAQHIHILPLLDYGEDDGLAYYVMPYIEHGTLKQHLDDGPLGMQEADLILTQVGEALQFLHESGVVHRDIKPANILLDEAGQAWLADLGLAKEVEGNQDMTKTGCIFGTPSYMAPELVSQPATSRSDIYALGIVLYEMLAGQRPFSGTTPLEICWKHTTTPPPPPSTFNPLISPAVEQVILQALEKDPQARFGTPMELAEAYHQAVLSPVHVAHPALTWLAEVSAATTIKSIPLSVPKQVKQSQRRAQTVVLLLALLLLFGAVTFAIEVQGPARSGAQIIATHHVATRVSTPMTVAGQAGAVPSVATSSSSVSSSAPGHHKPKHTHGDGD